jgi:cytochrome P450
VTTGLPEPIVHPLDLDEAGVNRPGLELNPLYHRIRESGTGVVPVARVNGQTALLVTRYEDVFRVFRDPVFSRAEALDADDLDLTGTMAAMDGTEHVELRRVIMGWLTPSAVRRKREVVQRQVLRKLNELTGTEPVDLMARFAIPYTLDTIADLLGIPEDSRDSLHGWAEAFLATSALTQDERYRRVQHMSAYFASLLEWRRSEPTDDLLSHIAAADLDPQRRVLLAVGMVLGGLDTTSSSIGMFFHVLCSRPYRGHDTAYAYLTSHPDEVESAVTELERMYGIGSEDGLPRRALAPVTLPSGAAVPAGAVVIPSYQAANYDPRAFPDPYTMDFGRQGDNRHLTFGEGAHYCAGRHLGHFELTLAFEHLSRQLPGLRPAIPVDQIPYKSGIATRGPTMLPVLAVQ